MKPLGNFEVAPNAQIKWIFDEEKYHLRFLPDKWNYVFTALQMFLIAGIFLGAYYEITRFVRKGLKKEESATVESSHKTDTLTI